MPQVSPPFLSPSSPPRTREEAKVQAQVYARRLQEQGLKTEIWDGEDPQKDKQYYHPQWSVAITFRDVAAGKKWIAENAYHYCIEEEENNVLICLTPVIDFAYNRRDELMWDGVVWEKESDSNGEEET